MQTTKTAKTLLPMHGPEFGFGGRLPPNSFFLAVFAVRFWGPMMGQKSPHGLNLTRTSNWTSPKPDSQLPGSLAV